MVEHILGILEALDSISKIKTKQNKTRQKDKFLVIFPVDYKSSSKL
jgi:hypothetical protein